MQSSCTVARTHERLFFCFPSDSLKIKFNLVGGRDVTTSFVMLRRVLSSRVTQLCLGARGDRRFLCGSYYQESTSFTPSRKPQIPLCERPATWTSTKEEVSSWYQEALDRIRVVGDGLHVDGGPTREDLELELQWIVEDAVVGWKGDGMTGNDTPVQMRMSLHELERMWDRRIDERMPLQYLTCCAFWRDMVLSVGPGVLIPRPETELMVDFVQDAVKRTPELALGEWADLGTGSGALAVALARALPDCPRVYAADIQPEPLEFASFNASKYSVGNRVKVVESNWYEGLQRAGVASLAGIVSNPPYIVADTIATLQAEVVVHEPVTALNGGNDLAVDSLMPICTGASDMLRVGGFLALETAGGEQAQYVAHVLENLSTFDDITIKKDLRGIERFVTASRR